MASTKSSNSKSRELRLPKLIFGPATANGYLVVTLLVFSFMIGTLLNKVLFLQNEIKTTNAQTANQTVAASPIPAQPTPPQFVKVENGKFPVLGSSGSKVTIV